MLSEITSLAEKLAPRLIEIRRHLHTNPELSGEEYQTAAYIAGVLSSTGIHVTESVGKTGVVGNLQGATKQEIPLPFGWIWMLYQSKNVMILSLLRPSRESCTPAGTMFIQRSV